MHDDPEGPSEPAGYGDDNRLDAAFAAYLRSCDQGDVEERDAFLAQFPDLEPELRRLIATADMLERFVTTPAPSRRIASPDAETVNAAFTGDCLPTPGGGMDGADGADVTSAAGHTPPPVDSRSLVTKGRGFAAGALGSQGGARRQDPNATLPAAGRPSDHPGPRLPFDLGDYRLQRTIGRGGMGIVYLATQSGLDREVAVKMIRSGILAGDDEVRRFRAEARAAGRLKHPNIVTVHHFGYLEGHHYFSMDYVAGTDLARKLADGPLEITDCARYVRDCARAIHYAHLRGILHRDLKPANVLIDEADQVRITDFGLAKHADNDSSLTASGTAVGTPNYMSPEQASGHGDRATGTADVYSLGAILFALLTGRAPFQGESIVQTLMQVVHCPVPSPREFRPDVPADLETIVYKSLEKDPKDRYQTAEMLAEDLDRFLEGRPVHAKARGYLKRVWHWFCDVPVIAALSGRRFLEASATHRRFQATVLILVLVLPLLIAAALWWQRWSHDQMPEYVRIAGGLHGGRYDDISGELARRISLARGVDATVVPTEGSIDNRSRLLAGQIHLAPMQASSIRGEELCVVAPLFYEVVHVLARRDVAIQSIADCKGRSVAVGPAGSGSQVAAELLFDSYQITGDVKPVVMPWQQLDEHEEIDAAIICIGVGSSLVGEFLREGEFRILAIAEGMQVSMDHPTLRPLNIPADAYPGAGIGPEGLPSVGMPAFLATRSDAPAVLVLSALEALYEPLPLFPGMIPRRRAAEYQGMKLHPAARTYFDSAP